VNGALRSRSERFVAVAVAVNVNDYVNVNEDASSNLDGGAFSSPV
jgi:hypothetical protein